MNILEILYVFGLLLIPLYEHVIAPLTGLHQRLPFMPLLLTSVYCSCGVSYVFIAYYVHALDIRLKTKQTSIKTASKPTKAKTKKPLISAKKEKTK